MQFTAKTERGFKAYSAPEGNVIRVMVYHSKGGMNYADYKVYPAGIYVSIQPMTVTVGEHFKTEQYAGFSGYGLYIKPSSKLNRNELKQVIDLLNPALDRFVELWYGDSGSAALKHLTLAIKDIFGTENILKVA